MTEHQITAQPKISFTFPGLAEGERETAYPTLSIRYRYSPGCPAFTPRGEYAPIDPPEPAEVEFISAELIDGDGLAPEPFQVQQWAEDWLNDEGYDAACSEAEANQGPDPDFLYEQARDDADMFVEDDHD